MSRSTPHCKFDLSADISPDGQKYLNTSYDGTAKIWNNSGFELYAVHGFDRYANQASFNKTGEYFFGTDTKKQWQSIGMKQEN